MFLNRAITKEEETMRDLGTMKQDERKEILRVYTSARKKGDTVLQENIRWAHPDLTEDFTKADWGVVEGSQVYA